MKFSELDLRELLEFKDGLIRFAGERSLLISANILGLLRKELNYLLGAHTTQGLYLRMGFTHGWMTAERIRQDLPWDSDDEWRRAGGRLHALQGHVLVEVPKWRSDEPEPFAYSVWRDSYEAEQHLRFIGHSQEPVCWMLTGFVSGYLSFANGRRVIAREEQCRACGDAVCHMVARFEDDWNGEVDDIKALLDSPCLADGLSHMRDTLLEVEKHIEAKTRQLGQAGIDESGIIARSEAMRRIIDLARRVARVDSVVLVTGESGSGKERVANLIHQESDRAHGPFLAVNCGAVTESLLESELFGHTRGSFTGATQDRAGLFEAARGGTLFLDEVGELPHTMQVKLLRVIQEREVRRVGENRARSVDVRLIAATHRDLAAEVAAGNFREDLFYRLKVIQIRIPPLRERKDDVLPLARFFLKKMGARLNRDDLTGFDPNTANLMLHHSWPGNVRELENAVEHAVVLASESRIKPEDLPEELHTQTVQTITATPGKTLEEVEKDYILATLESNGGNQTKTAQQLGIGTATLYRKLRKYEK